MAVSSDKIFVVWTDMTSNTIKFSYATTNIASSTADISKNPVPTIFYNNENHLLNVESTVATTLKIIDMSGNVVMKRDLTAGLSKVDLGRLSPSIYFCHFLDGNKLLTTYKINSR